MTRFVVLEPAGVAGPSPEAVLVRDRFSALTCLFPWAWLLHANEILAGCLVLVAQVGLVAFVPFGGVFALLVGLLVALEGPRFLLWRRTREGFSERAFLQADDLGEAEMIYFGGARPLKSDPDPAPVVAPAQVTGRSGGPSSGKWQPARTLLATMDRR